MRPAEGVLREPEPEPVQEPAAVPRWSLARRIAFRFLFSYFLLFFLTGQEINYVPGIAFLAQKYTELWYAVAVWIGRHLFGISYDFPLFGDGSGDTTFRWLLLPCYVTLAGVATVVWSVLDRRRAEYQRLHQWFRLLLRFSLAVTLIFYGLIKVIPNQMPAPNPFILLQRVGELTPMRMLWIFMGSSPAYQTFTGLAELLGGVLLLVPRTTLLGAVIAVADFTMIFMLNMAYDVPVKIMSFHLLVMSLLLLAPDLPRLADLFLFNRTVPPAPPPPPLFADKVLDRVPHIFLFVFGLYVIGLGIVGGIERYKERNPPRPPLYGAWSVEEPGAKEEEEPPSTEADRWRWVVIQRPGGLFVEHASGARRPYALDLDVAKKSMTLWDYQRGPDGKMLQDAAGKGRRLPGPKAELTFTQPEADTLVLDGILDGQRQQVRLRKMALIGQRFHWVLDPPPAE